MNYEILNIVLYLIGFCIFIFIQALVINGIYECFRGGCVDDINKGKVCNGNIFYKISPKFFEKHKDKIWTLPLWNCVKCMSSVWSALTFFPVAIWLFGFHWCELFIWAIDAFCLVTVNWYIYKKL